MSIKNVILIGASGNVGKPVLDAINAAGKFNVTVLSRKTSTAASPEGVKVVKADYSSHSELVEAFKGQDVIINTVGDPQTLESTSAAFWAAAIDAGVKRVIPSDFGGDLENSPGKDSPFFAAKVRAARYLEKLGEEGKLVWTSIGVGPFFDWGLPTGLHGFDLKGKTAIIYDGGDAKYNTTKLPTIGDAVVAVLFNPDAYKNKHVYIHDFFISQNDILKVLEAKLGKFTIKNVSAEETSAEAYGKLAKGEFGLQEVIFPIIQASIFGKKESNSRWGEDDDSKALALKRLDLEEEISKLLA